MALWIILVLGWLTVLLLAVALVRIARYTEKKMRGLANRPRGRQEQAPSEVLPQPIRSQETSSPTSREEDEKIA